MAENKSGFSDPLDSIVNRIKESNKTSGGQIKTPESLVDKTDEIINGSNKNASVAVKSPSFEDTIILDDDVNYGDNDADEELAKLEKQDEEDRNAKIEEARIAREENKPVDLPHNSLDADEVAADLDHQGSNAIIVSKMIDQVVAMHHLPSGGVPTYDPKHPKEKIELKFPIMGELMACYLKDGAQITKQFEDLILDNWYLDSGITARQYVNNGYKDITSRTDDTIVEDTDTSSDDDKSDDGDNTN